MENDKYKTLYRVAVALAVVAMLLLVWVVGAVGIIGSSGNRANMLFFVPIVIGLVTALSVRLRPEGMAIAAYVTALALIVVAVVAILLGMTTPASGAAEILGLTGFYAVLFAASGMLFRRASLARASTE